jgi:SAM-dependent methyltransferase
VTSPPSDRPPTTYEPREHWSALHRVGGLKAVGQSGLPESLNRWLYRIGRRNVRAFMATHGLADLDGAAVLDVGSGTGFWIDLWSSLGAAQVDGVDISPDAVERLRERLPDATFLIGDIADPTLLPPDPTYDAVMVMNVLLHIVEEEQFAAAAANLAATLKPGGRLLLAEPALVRTSSARPPRPGATSVARPLARYRDVLETHGLEFVAVGPSTVVGANPIETDDPRYDWYAALWKRVARSARKGPRRGAALGAGLAVVDRILMLTGAAPSGKLVLFARPRTTRSP